MMGVYAAQCMAGVQEEMGAGMAFELFTHVTRFMGHKVRAAGRSCAFDACAAALLEAALGSATMPPAAGWRVEWQERVKQNTAGMHAQHTARQARGKA